MYTGLLNVLGPRAGEGNNGPSTSSAVTQSTRPVEIAIPSYDEDNSDDALSGSYSTHSVMLSHVPLGGGGGGPQQLHLQHPPQQQPPPPGGPQHSQPPNHGPPQQSPLHSVGQPPHGMNQQTGPGPGPGGPGGLQIPPPPPQNGQDQTLSNVLHFLQSEWRRYERDRNEWEVERAEMRARIALLEGERRSFENVKLDLMRRIKMLEYALRMERSKQLSQSSVSLKAASVTHSDKQATSSNKEDNQSAKEGSVSSSPRSDDIPLPGDPRFSISSLPAPTVPATTSVSAPNGMVGASTSTPLKKEPSLPLASSWPALTNGKNDAIMANLAKPPAGRDAKSRARSREYLKQCIQEVNYLTSPPALNPLPNRPLLSIPPASNPPGQSVPLSLPNLPTQLGQGITDMSVGYNGRPRKGVPDIGGMGKEFPLMNGATLPSTSAGPSNDKDTRDMSKTFQPNNSANFGLQTQQNLPAQSGQPSHPLASEILPSPSTSSTSASDTAVDEAFRLEESALAREEEDLAALRREEFGDDVEAENENGVEDESDKVWKARRTLRNHLDAVRALAFHPLELCLATGGDDYTVKIWRLDAGDLAAASPTGNPGSTISKASTTEIEPQLTLRGHTGSITRLVHSASKHLLYSASVDATIHVWVLPPTNHPTYVAYDSSRSRGVLVGHTDAVWDLAVVRDESLLISCGADGLVKVWNVGGPLQSLKLSWGYGGLGEKEGQAELELEENPPGATALEPLKTDLKKVAVGYQNSSVKIYDIDTGVQVGALQNDAATPSGQVNQLVSHPTMPLLVTGHEDKYIRIWDIFTGQCTYSNLAHLQPITSLSIDAAGFSLVSGSHDCSIRFWDLINTRQCTQEVQPHREKAKEGVLDVEFHPTLPFMASAGADGTVKLFASS